MQTVYNNTHNTCKNESVVQLMNVLTLSSSSYSDEGDDSMMSNIAVQVSQQMRVEEAMQQTAKKQSLG